MTDQIKTCETCAHREKYHAPKRSVCDLDSDFRGESRVTLMDTCDRWEKKEPRK
jgi:hypothetical protein